MLHRINILSLLSPYFWYFVLIRQPVTYKTRPKDQTNSLCLESLLDENVNHDLVCKE